MTYSIYKIGGLSLNTKCIVMILETQIKYTLMKLNMPLQRNFSVILCHYEIVKEELISHCTQGFAQYVKLYFLQNYQVAGIIQNCYQRTKNHLYNCVLYIYLKQCLKIL